MKIEELRTRITEVFSSISIFCPNFPAAAQTNTERKFGQLTEMVNTLLERAKDDAPKQWLRVSLQEIGESLQRYQEGNSQDGRKILERAEQHFKHAFSRKPTSPRFQVGESGSTQDTASGFPELFP
jgi:hypothetical protein